MTGKVESIRDKVIEPIKTFEMIGELFSYTTAPIVCDRDTFEESSLFEGHRISEVQYGRICSLLKAYGWKRHLCTGESYTTTFDEQGNTIESVTEESYSQAPISWFVNGCFLPDDFTYDERIEKDIAEFAALRGERFSYEAHRAIHIRYYFTALLMYRLKMYPMENIFSGYIQLPIGKAVAKNTTLKHVHNTYVSPMKKYLDELLLTFLRGNEHIKPYTIGELIDNFGYPKVTDDELEDMRWNNI